ncbi:MAG: hypothetical protein MJ126_04615 [Lachnospiraceae bacterium]|nr:hypothetical protein [Lachnospiraceae bacterium]
MKTKRFVYEYANGKLKEFNDNPAMQDCYKQEAKRNIEIVIQQCEYGYISIDECIRKISDPFIIDVNTGETILHNN